jgi:uncharacterized protein YkwD
MRTAAGPRFESLTFSDNPIKAMTVMCKRIVSLLILVLLAACAAQKPRPTPAPAPVPPPTTQPSPPSITVNGLEQKVIDATNAFRAQNSLTPLKPKVQLIVIAQNHARNMARQDKFGDSDQNGHILDGHNFEYRIEASGYAFDRAAENVGFQRIHGDPAAAMMEDWKHSPGHRRNMLIPDITEIGVGAAQGKSGRWYFVQVFGRPQSRAKQTMLDE